MGASRSSSSRTSLLLVMVLLLLCCSCCPLWQSDHAGSTVYRIKACKCT